MGARTARPIGEYYPRPFQGAQGSGGSIEWNRPRPVSYHAISTTIKPPFRNSAGLLKLGMVSLFRGMFLALITFVGYMTVGFG